MGVFDQFPYTNFQELNLDWVIKTVKECKAYIEFIQETIDRIIAENAQINADIWALKYDFRNQVARLDALIKEINITIDNMHFATEEELEAKVSQIYKDLDLNIKILKDDVKLLYSYIDTLHHQQKDYIDKEVGYLQNQINKIQLKPVQQVISPVSKKQAAIQVALNDLYQNLYDVLGELWGLTAQEYDYLYITAKQYDDAKLTVTQYDYVAKWYLWELYKKICNVLGINAEDYDALEFTAEEYDNLNLTAIKYDTLAMWYLGPYPFETVDGVHIKSILY